MSDEEQETIGSIYNIAELLKYSGPTLQRQEPLEDGIALIGYRNTDANARNIPILLSAQGIEFNMKRPGQGWEPKVRMTIVVLRSQYKDALALLQAAAKAKVVETIEGDEGLISY
jgi:hypothetical protein